MQVPTIDRVVPRCLRQANNVVRSLMRYYPRAGRAACRAACARLFGHDSWEELEGSRKQQRPSAPFDEACTDLPGRREAQAHVLCSSLGGVDPKGSFGRPVPHPSAGGSNFWAEVRLGQAEKRYQQLLAQVIIDEVQPTAYEPEEYGKGEILAGAPRGTIAALPLYLARWWNVNLKHQREVAQGLENWALDADSRADLLQFGQYWGALCMYHAGAINWTMVMGTACLLAERYADLSLPNLNEVRAHNGRVAAASQVHDRLCQLHYLFVIEYLSVFPRDDLEELVTAQPEAFLDSGEDVLKILANPRSTRGTWRHGAAG